MPAQQQAQPCRDHQPGGRGRDGAERVMDERRLGLTEQQKGQDKADRSGDHHETDKRGECSCHPAGFGADADRDADDIWAGHELAQGQDITELGFAEPPPSLDGTAMRQNDAAAGTEQRNLEEFPEKRAERGARWRLDRRDERRYCRLVANRNPRPRPNAPFPASPPYARSSGGRTPR